MCYQVLARSPSVAILPATFTFSRALFSGMSRPACLSSVYFGKRAHHILKDTSKSSNVMFVVIDVQVCNVSFVFFYPCDKIFYDNKFMTTCNRISFSF